MQQEKPRYTIHSVRKPPSIAAEVGVVPEGWSTAEVGVVDNWHSKSSSNRPPVYFRVLRDAQALYVRFDVLDRHVVSLMTKPQSAVCRDSCVEFFVQPAPGKAYFNFEINAGGTMLLYFIENPRRLRTGGFAKFRPVAAEWMEQVKIGHSLPPVVKPAISEPIAWAVAFRIPLDLFTAHLGEVCCRRGSVWHGNFYKCGGARGFTHWGAWADVGRLLNFHQPARFGDMVLG